MYATLALLILSLPALAAQVQLNGRNFTVPDGFEIELISGPPLSERPIVADFDERGRLYVAESSGTVDNVQKQLKDKPHRIVRLEDTDGDGRFDQRIVFADRMMFPEGAMWHAGSLYVAAPPSIWKLTDTDGDGVAERREEWFNGKTLTGCANDLHGPYLGLDGMIYWCKGAFAKQEYVLPDGRPFVTRAAHIFRARPDGRGIEPVMTGGMDNPVEVAFTPGGERIFTTTFLQHPGGGRRDGLIHAIYGGVYGKVHDVIDDPSHIRTGPDVMPVLSHLGPAAPSGLCRYESEAFGPAYRDNLFTAAFNLQKVVRHELSEDGGTFKSKDSDFLVCDSRDFHPTDVLEDADGSLIVIDTGGWYKLCCPTSQLHKPDILGSIYRIRRTGAARIDDPRGLKIHWDQLGAAKLAALLGDGRPAVRKQAMAALPMLFSNAEARADVLPALAHAMPGLDARGRSSAVWAATRIDDPAARALVRGAVADSDDTVRHAALNSIALWRDRRAMTGVLEVLSSAAAHHRRAAAEALGRIGDPSAVAALLEVLRRAPGRALEHSVLYAVIEIGDAKAVRPGLAANDPAIQRGAMIALDQIAGGGLAPGDIAAFLGSPDEKLRDSAAWVAGRHRDWGDALAGAFRQRLSVANLSESDRASLQEQLARLASSEGIAALLADLVNGDSDDRRRLALAAMGDAGLRQPPQAWLDALAGAIAGDRSISAAANTVRRLNLKPDAAAQITASLLKAAARPDIAPADRIELLAAVPGGIGAPDEAMLSFLLEQSGPEQPVAQRLEAAGVIARCRLSREQLIRLAAAVREAGPLEIGMLLAPFETSGDDGVGETLLDALEHAGASSSLRSEFLAAKLKKYPPEIRSRAQAMLAARHPDAEKQKAVIEQALTRLPAGDIRRGQAIFNSARAACSTCHAIGYLGGHVGPDLTRIGSVRQERDLLESILYPSASFVQSFEPVIVETEDDTYSGILRRNDAREVILVTGAAENQELRIPRSDIRSQRPGQLSIMPAGLEQQLSREELADLIAFLQACR